MGSLQCVPLPYKEREMLRIPEVKLNIDEDIKLIPEKISNKLGIAREQMGAFSIYKESIDARKGRINFVYTVDIEIEDEETILQNNPASKISKVIDDAYKYVDQGPEIIEGRPVVVGFGPSGMFSALILSEMGYKPLVIERGKRVEERAEDVALFWKEGKFVADSNVQFGEGGAGTFSDGKLTTRIKDLVRCRKVLEAFITAGAPQEILYKQKPHLGTDILQKIVENIRKQIIELGGEIRFNSKMTDIKIHDGKITAIEINENEEITTNCIILGVGHSARDTFEMLYNKGVKMEQKAFSIGVRIEHHQEVIDKTQYGKYAGHPKLGAADYKLVHHCKNGRGAYTFCMCPGGVVVASASEKEGVVTNGMSYFKRDGSNANSALLVDVRPDDFRSEHHLAGIDYQRMWEKKAWELGGACFNAPTQKVGDFLKGIPSKESGEVKPTYKPGTCWTDLSKCLPNYVVESLKEAIPQMGKKLKGFDMEEGVLTAIETRSSSAVRILRDNMLHSNIEGLLPVGEGSGYAGGIISAAVDGIKAAEAVATRFKPIK